MAANDLINDDISRNSSPSSITSIPSKPTIRVLCCWCSRLKKTPRDKKEDNKDEEPIVVENDDQREDLEIQNSGSDRSTVDFEEVSATDR